MRVSSILRRHVGNIGEISGMVATATELNLYLSSVLNYAFIFGLLLLFGGEWLFGSLFPWDYGRRIARLMRDNQVVVLSVLFLFHYVSGMLLNTGAFEIYLNDQLIFSKLKTGGLPDVDWLVNDINTRVNHNNINYRYNSQELPDGMDEGY